ncbi:MAG: hypothetical protein SFY92_09635 [Verrucomicrobiae bacterium]|nr:hypothetical protein [Verrucomicrobiae bacterium]
MKVLVVTTNILTGATISNFLLLKRMKGVLCTTHRTFDMEQPHLDTYGAVMLDLEHQPIGLDTLEVLKTSEFQGARIILVDSMDRRANGKVFTGRTMVVGKPFNPHMVLSFLESLSDVGEAPRGYYARENADEIHLGRMALTPTQ